MTKKDKQLADKIFDSNEIEQFDNQQFDESNFSVIEQQQLELWADLFESFSPDVIKIILSSNDNFIAPPTNISLYLN